MTTIGEQLKQVEDKHARERIARRSDMLRKFVKEDLLAALKEDIERGGSGRKAVEAPKEIQHLFAAPLNWDGHSPHTSKSSPYNNVWRELDAWAESENLEISTGTPFDEGKYGGVPWDMRRWGGYLKISVPKPQPVKPTPPAPIKQEQGANITMANLLWGMAIAVIGTFILTYFGIRH